MVVNILSEQSRYSPSHVLLYYLRPLNIFSELQVHSFFNFWATNDGRGYTEEQALFGQNEIRLLILALLSPPESPLTFQKIGCLLRLCVCVCVCP